MQFQICSRTYLDMIALNMILINMNCCLQKILIIISNYRMYFLKCILYFLGLSSAIACPCKSHDECEDFGQPRFCCNGRCQDKCFLPGSIGMNGNPSATSDGKSLNRYHLDNSLSGRYNWKKCSSQRDCEWYESCVAQYGICWRTWPRM